MDRSQIEFPFHMSALRTSVKDRLKFPPSGTQSDCHPASRIPQAEDETDSEHPRCLVKLFHAGLQHLKAQGEETGSGDIDWGRYYVRKAVLDTNQSERLHGYSRHLQFGSTHVMNFESVYGRPFPA